MGQTGPVGYQGKDGVGLHIKGAYETLQELPPGNPGDAYFVKQTLYVWNDSQIISAVRPVPTVHRGALVPPAMPARRDRPDQ